VSLAPTPSQPDPALDAPAPAAPAGADLLLELFSGKRGRERHPCHVPATLDGARGAVACTVLDLSEGGALLQIDDPVFTAADAHGGLQAYLELLQVHAQPGLALSFPEQDLRLESWVVRWTAGSAGAGPSRVGLRFGRALQETEVHALRSGTRLPTRPPAEPASRPTHVPARDARLQALVFLALKPEVGPLLSGTATAFGPELLVVHLAAGRTEQDLKRVTGSGALFVAVIESPRTHYESTARFLALVANADGSFKLLLAPRAPWTPALLKRLRKG